MFQILGSISLTERVLDFEFRSKRKVVSRSLPSLVNREAELYFRS